VPVPAFLTRPAPAASTIRPLTPSAAAAILEPSGGRDPAWPAGPDALARARGAEDGPARRGRLVHRLIELLPDLSADVRAARATAHLARVAADLSATDRDEILASVLGILGDARFAAVFGPGSRAEVAVAGTLPVRGTAGIPVFGQIDRLVHGPDGILVVDFKTGRTVPDVVPLAYATQLALYRALLMSLHPGVPVRAAILWTEAPRFDEVIADDLDALVTQLVTNMGTHASTARS
jgi:ATP-dependent helicase/nuclease subunit A